MKQNPVLDKSFAFALRITRLYRHLQDAKHEYVLSRELLMAGTQIGKHVKEAVNAETRQVFVNEMGVARRKASETEYWLQLLNLAEFITDKELESVEADRVEIAKMLTSIVKTSKES